MWQLEPTEKFNKKLDKYKKKNVYEALAVLENLDLYFKTLLELEKPLLIKAGFIHIETKGVIALDQSGYTLENGKKLKLKQTRLYIYADTEEEKVYLITIGDKNSQQKTDLPDCRKFMKKRSK